MVYLIRFLSYHRCAATTCSITGDTIPTTSQRFALLVCCIEPIVVHVFVRYVGFVPLCVFKTPTTPREALGL